MWFFGPFVKCRERKAQKNLRSDHKKSQKENVVGRRSEGWLEGFGGVLRHVKWVEYGLVVMSLLWLPIV